MWKSWCCSILQFSHDCPSPNICQGDVSQSFLLYFIHCCVKGTGKGKLGRNDLLWFPASQCIHPDKQGMAADMCGCGHITSPVKKWGERSRDAWFPFSLLLGQGVQLMELCHWYLEWFFSFAESRDSFRDM